MNARERVREALLCRKPDKIPKALGFFDQSVVCHASLDCHVMFHEVF